MTELTRQRGLVVWRDAAAASAKGDAESVQETDASSAMAAAGFGVAGLRACDVPGGALEQLMAWRGLEQGGLYRGIGGATDLLQRQDFFPPPRCLRR